MLAGGSGSRVGAAANKVYLPLAGRPMIAWSLRAFVGAPGIGPVLLVIRDADREPAAELLAGEPGWAEVELVTGGRTRQESELAGLRRLADRIRAGRVDVVLVHDGARPMVSRALLAAVLRTAREVGGAVPGLPRDDLALAAPDEAGRATVLTGPAPPGLVAVQTPQGFRAAPAAGRLRGGGAARLRGHRHRVLRAALRARLPIRALPGRAATSRSPTRTTSRWPSGCSPVSPVAKPLRRW